MHLVQQQEQHWQYDRRQWDYTTYVASPDNDCHRSAQNTGMDPVTCEIMPAIIEADVAHRSKRSATLTSIEWTPSSDHKQESPVRKRSRTDPTSSRLSTRQSSSFSSSSSRKAGALRTAAAERFNACIPCRTRKIRCVPSADGHIGAHPSTRPCATCLKRDKQCTWPITKPVTVTASSSSRSDKARSARIIEERRIHPSQSSWTVLETSVQAEEVGEEDAEGEEEGEELAPELQPSETIGEQLSQCFQPFTTRMHYPTATIKPTLTFHDVQASATEYDHGAPSRLQLDCFLDAPPSLNSFTAPPSPITPSSSPPPSASSSQLTSFSESCEHMAMTSIVTSQPWSDIGMGDLLEQYAHANQTPFTPFYDQSIGAAHFMPLFTPPAEMTASLEPINCLDWSNSDFIPSQSE